ncbi:MAG: hypothetical protein ABI852_08655 [Gemmatimonadaceae bacterium]
MKSVRTQTSAVHFSLRLAISVAAFAFGATASAQENRTVTGRVVRPVAEALPQAGAPRTPPATTPGITAAKPDSTGLAAVPNAMVTLHRVGKDTQAPLDSMRTTSDGSYTFKYKTSGAADAVYFTSVTWGGIAYFTAPLRTATARGNDAEITVFDTTTKSFPLTVSGRHLIISAADTTNHRTVIEVFELSNDSIKTLTSGADSLGTPTWSVEVPSIARDVKAGEGEISTNAFTTTSGRVAIYSAIAPGVKQVSFSYRVPAQAFPLSFPVEHGAVVMEVLIEEPNGMVTGGGLAAADPQSIENRTFRRFLAQDVKDGTVLNINLPSRPGVGRNLYIAALLGTIGVIMLLILLRAMQRNRAPSYVGLPPVRVKEAPLADRLAREIADLDATYAKYENPNDAMREAYEERRAELKDALAAEIARGR